jgi:hypothetical protein
MSLGLTIIPVNSLELRKDRQITLGFDRLRVDCDARALETLLYDVEQLPLEPIVLWNYEDNGIRKRRTDSYGGKLKTVYAYALYSAMKELPQPDKAVMAYLKALPKFTRVILYWS